VIIPISLAGAASPLVLVPVGAILVGSVHLHFARLSRRRRGGHNRQVRCQASFRRGEELGYFHHGSTIIVLAPPGLEPVTGVVEGTCLRMGQPLLRHVSAGGVASSSRNAPAT
jgi:phosphatidylserine decarboxylase